MAAKKFLSGIDLASQKIVNLADGSSNSDAATYGQLLALAHGLVWHDACEAASTADITIASPGATIDGVTMGTGDRVLLKNQSTDTQNGIYVYATSTTPMTRALDADGTAELMPGSAVFVLQGTANAATSWVIDGDAGDTITIGTDSITWLQFGAGGTTYSNGNGLNLSGSTFSVKPLSNGGILVASGGVSVIAGDSIIVDGGGVSVSAGDSSILTGSGVMVNAGDGLETTSDLHVLAADTSVTVNGSGVAVHPKTNGGLDVSSGLEVKQGTGITVDGSGVSVTDPKLKYAALIGDGSTTSIVVTHSLGTRDVMVSVYDASTYAEVDVACEHTSTTTITLIFAVAPTSNAYRVVVMG